MIWSGYLFKLEIARTPAQACCTESLYSLPVKPKIRAGLGLLFHYVGFRFSSFIEATPFAFICSTKDKERRKESNQREILYYTRTRNFELRRKSVKPDNVNSQLYMLEGAKSIGAGAATIALAGAAVGIGNVLSSSIHSVARNPSLAKQSFGYAILGFALTEAIASFAPMMAFLISFVF